MTGAAMRAWAAFQADRYLDSRRPEWAAVEARGGVRFVRSDGVDVVLVHVDCDHIVRALRPPAAPVALPFLAASVAVPRRQAGAGPASSAPRWEPGWPPGVVPGALLWLFGVLGFIAAVTGPLNVPALAASLLFAGRGLVQLLTTSEVEGR
jgi:hypothetical protein